MAAAPDAAPSANTRAWPVAGVSLEQVCKRVHSEPGLGTGLASRSVGVLCERDVLGGVEVLVLSGLSLVGSHDEKYEGIGGRLDVFSASPA